MDRCHLPRSTGTSLFLLSAATLIFEINLTRLFSVAQFYHFAFMVISIALLGFGASGTWLALFPHLSGTRSEDRLAGLSLAAGLSILCAYLITNLVPFDSFSLFVDSRQVWILVLHYLVLALPFFFNGLVVAILLTTHPDSVGRTYSINLTGSASGCVLAMIIPVWLGGEGTVLFCSVTAVLGAVLVAPGEPMRGSARGRMRPPVFLFPAVLLLFLLLLLSLTASGKVVLPWLSLHLSPYKGLSYALQVPEARVSYQRWNGFSRVDLVNSPAIRSLPGLSYRYLRVPPSQAGLFVDGDDLSPVIDPQEDLRFAEYLPAAVAYDLRPAADVLVLSPRGGLDVLTALALGAQRVTAVEINPLVLEAAGAVYEQPQVDVVNEAERSFLRRTGQRFDLIVFSLTSSYHPIGSGAYSLVEDYRYTVEAFQDALAQLKPDGMLVVTRWLQETPSETLRVLALSAAALEAVGGDPADQIVAFRGYQTATFLVCSRPFTPAELHLVREDLASRSFDLSYAPDMRLEETNRYNVLPEPVYYQTYRELLGSASRQEFYRSYSYDVRPPSDDHPFFGHYFKWSQVPGVLAGLGRTWQPFGGAGYLVIIALLALALAAAGVLIVLPVGLKAAGGGLARQDLWRPLLYFGSIGLAYLLVEVPLIQRFIHYLGNPAYALTTVLFNLLVFSGIGSRLSERFPLRWTLFSLVVLLGILPALLPGLFALTLDQPLALRLGVTTLLLAPVGFCMGYPLPAGIKWFAQDDGKGGIIPWVWAVNGSASVVSSVLAALLALSFGFRWVFYLGAGCYALALVTVGVSARPCPAGSPPR